MIKHLLIILFSLNHVFAQGNQVYQGRIWGKVIKKNSPKAIGSYQYFLVFKDNGQTQAFPIEVNDKIKTAVEEAVGKTVKIEANIIENRKYYDGQPLQFYSVKVNKMKTMTLADLMPKGDVKIAKRYRSSTSGSTSQGGGIELPDNVANTAIFAAGAALIFSMLKK